MGQSPSGAVVFERGGKGACPPKQYLKKIAYLLWCENNFDYNFAYQRVKSMKSHGFFRIIIDIRLLSQICKPKHLNFNANRRFLTRNFHFFVINI